MNKERIRELYKNVLASSENMRWNIEDAEKFAKLIVKECSGVNYNSSFQDGEFHARELLEHFGVEE